jgi:hypothetical protein
MDSYGVTITPPSTMGIFSPTKAGNSIANFFSSSRGNAAVDVMEDATEPAPLITSGTTKA